MFMYNIGEKVRIIDNLDHETSIDPLTIAPEMYKYCGTEHEISGRFKEQNFDVEYNRYRLKDVRDRKFAWVWAEEWLEPVDDNDIDIEEDTIVNLLME